MHGFTFGEWGGYNSLLVTVSPKTVWNKAFRIYFLYYYYSYYCDVWFLNLKFSKLCIINIFKSTVTFLLHNVYLEICKPQLSYICVHALALLQFVLMIQTHLFAGQIEPITFLGSKLAPVSSSFSSARLWFALYPSRIIPVAWNLFTYMQSALMLITGAFRNFHLNLWWHFL